MNTNRTNTELNIASQRTTPTPSGAARVTINELAHHLGMSKSTVSRALNGYTDISESTRNLVASTAKKMGYRPLSHAQAIRTGRVRALALVLQSDEPDRHNPFLQDFLAGACEAASDLGWTVTIATAKSGRDMEVVLDRLIEERKADGFILPRTEVADPRVTLLRNRRVPFVLYGRIGYGQQNADAGCSWFDILGETAMRDAVLRLTDLGHSRIGYVGSHLNFNYSHLRLEGFLAGLSQAGLPQDAQLLHRDARTREEGARATRALLALDLPPTAIVYATDMAALGAYPVLKKMGLRIGQDLSVISYDGVPESEYVHPALTTYGVDTRDAGARLASLLIRQIRGEPPEDLRELQEARLIERASDGPPALTPEALAEKLQKS